MRSPQPGIRQGRFPASFTAPQAGRTAYSRTRLSFRTRRPPPTLAGRPTAAHCTRHGTAARRSAWCCLRERGGACLRVRRVNERPCRR
jgi:hypothetical protein